MERLKPYAYDWIACLLFLALPLVIFWQSATSLEEQGVAHGGPMDNAALFPRMVAWLLLGLALVNGVRLAMGRGARTSPVAPTETTPLAVIVAGCFVVYLMAVPYLGYHLATPVLMALLLRLFGIRNSLSLCGGIAMSLVVAAVFQGLLNVVLPVGMFKITLFG
ncbi:tripartite tricarboxylate transporter TctB family protein [uncultured Hoeflea sp.]|uniref:tripartite tricarboxylate transporter TctB family protein n=1 Tax=uncultured Hoeflea sp. TaxID=538666 RepID=UPI0030D771D6|tara:strand:+ start:801 stop:1292 length:492 start_codon:yes stop_codon:yes gene_type:complete